MKIMQLLILVCMFSCTVKKKTESSSPAPLLSDTAGHGAIQSLLKKYYEDMSARDWEKYRGYFWKNATITTQWKQPGDSLPTVDITTIDDFIKETPNGPDSQPIFEEHMQSSEIHMKGNIAEAWVSYSAKFGSKGSLSEWSGTDVFTFLLHEDQWKIVSLVFETDQ